MNIAIYIPAAKRSQKFLLAASMYIAMFSDAENMLGHKNCSFGGFQGFFSIEYTHHYNSPVNNTHKETSESAL